MSLIAEIIGFVLLGIVLIIAALICMLAVAAGVIDVLCGRPGVFK